MKIQEFAKYKKLAESSNPLLLENEDAIRVFQWMEKTGRIQKSQNSFEDEEHLDEGILSSIWNWLKRNFSFTARRLHSLADDYEKELREELLAEWKKTKNPKDLASKFRAGTYNRLSRDIEEKMKLIAEKDEVYRELVSALINERDLKVKKEVLRELTGLMDPEDSDTKYLKRIRKDAEDDYPEASAAAEKLNRKLLMDKKPQIDEIVKFMKKKLIDEKTQFRILELSSESSQQEFIKLLYTYVSALSEKDKSVEFEPKTVYRAAKDYLEIAKELIRRLVNNGMDEDRALEKATKILNTYLKDIVNVRQMKIIKSAAIKDAEKVSSEKEKPSRDDKEIKSAVTSEFTEEFIDDEEVEDGIEVAKEETGKKKPDTKDILKEIRETIEETFQDDNLDIYKSFINKRVKTFNEQEESVRKNEAKKYDYELESDNTLRESTLKDVKELVPAFIDLVGAIVPYYFSEVEDKSSELVTIVKRYLFEIYAMKKDGEKLSSSQKEQLIENIKEKYLKK